MIIVLRKCTSPSFLFQIYIELYATSSIFDSNNNNNNNHTHYGTPFLRPKAYKARVEGVSPQSGIEQIRAGET